MILKINMYSEKIDQLEAFLNSNIYADQNSYNKSKSPHWIHEANNVKCDIDQKGNVNLDGQSVYYIPEKKIHKRMKIY